VNRQFQAKMPKYENRSIDKIVNQIKPKFDNKAESVGFCRRYDKKAFWCIFSVHSVDSEHRLQILQQWQQLRTTLMSLTTRPSTWRRQH